MKPVLVAVGFCCLALATGAGANGDTPPPMPTWHTDATSCSWHWREGGGIGLWSQTCSFNDHDWQLGWDMDRKAFVTRRDSEVIEISVEPFALPKGAGIEALTQALVDAGHLAADAACTWQSIGLRPAPRTMTFHMLTPSDPDAARATPSGEVPEPACGPYGASTHGVRYFITDLRWPGRAIFVDEGQERPLFEPSSITALP